MLAQLADANMAKIVIDVMYQAGQPGPWPNNLLFYVKWICVGNEPLLADYKDQYKDLIGPAVKNVYSALQANPNLKKIGVTVPQNFQFMTPPAWPPSSGKIQTRYKQIITDTCNVMRQSGAPFMVNIYPFLTHKGDPKNVPLDYANFTLTAPRFTDSGTGKPYYNLFDSMLDALNFALKDIGYGDLEIVVGECGWPTAGDPEATTQNAATFLEKLIAHCKSGKGTPIRPNKTIQCFAFEMYDEDMKNTGPGAFEHYWGIYDGQGKAKFPGLKW